MEQLEIQKKGQKLMRKSAKVSLQVIKKIDMKSRKLMRNKETCRKTEKPDAKTKKMEISTCIFMLFA